MTAAAPTRTPVTRPAALPAPAATRTAPPPAPARTAPPPAPARTAPPPAPVRLWTGPATPAAATLLAAARRGLLEAALAPVPAERYAAAHLAALRSAAAVLADRARPQPAARRRPTSAWVLLAAVAPELGEWAAFFAAGAGKRAAAEAGLPSAVTAREADDLVRDAQTFLAVVETTLGRAHQRVLPPASAGG